MKAAASSSVIAYHPRAARGRPRSPVGHVPLLEPSEAAEARPRAARHHGFRNIRRWAGHLLLLSPALLLGAGNFSEARSDPTADASRGAKLIAAAGCGSCHAIPGITGADGKVGPPLGGVASRAFIAGVLANTPDNLVAWIEAPQRIRPGNAMPDMALDEHEARDIAAYLETLH